MKPEERARQAEHRYAEGSEGTSEYDISFVEVVSDAIRAAEAAAYRRGLEDAARMSVLWVNNQVLGDLPSMIRALAEKETTYGLRPKRPLAEKEETDA